MRAGARWRGSAEEAHAVAMSFLNVHSYVNNAIYYDFIMWYVRNCYVSISIFFLLISLWRHCTNIPTYGMIPIWFCTYLSRVSKIIIIQSRLGNMTDENPVGRCERAQGVHDEGTKRSTLIAILEKLFILWLILWSKMRCCRMTTNQCRDVSITYFYLAFTNL